MAGLQAKSSRTKQSQVNYIDDVFRIVGSALRSAERCSNLPIVIEGQGAQAQGGANDRRRLTTVPVITPGKAQELQMAQVDIQIGRDRRGYDRHATVGFGPGGVTIGPRGRYRMVTTTIQRDDGRTALGRLNG